MWNYRTFLLPSVAQAAYPVGMDGGLVNHYFLRLGGGSSYSNKMKEILSRERAEDDSCDSM